MSLGQPHAEHDRIRKDKTLIVRTPAALAALDPNRSKCFYVGRRGTGKTAITIFLDHEKKNLVHLHPLIFNMLGEYLDLDELRNSRQRTFQSIVSCFQRAIADEIFATWIEKGALKFSQVPAELVSERNHIEDNSFDTRMITFVQQMMNALGTRKDREWTRLKVRATEVCKALESVHGEWRWPEYLLLIDRIDDSWDGSDEAVQLLMALMHACLEITSSFTFVRPLLFLRENIFERVREIDAEFSRLDTMHVSLDWTRELLEEVIERRLQGALNPKPPIGQVWDVIFDKVDSKSSKDLVYDYCQERPRDIIAYCTHAIEAAQARRRQTVAVEDLISARRKFSQGRLKDLGDEYSENYGAVKE